MPTKKDLELELGLMQANMNTLAQEFDNHAKLISIHRDGRKNVFTFARNGHTFTIETFSMLADDIDAWKNKAGIM